MKSILKAMRKQARYLGLNVNFPKKPNSTGVRKQHVAGTLCRSRLLQ